MQEETTLEEMSDAVGLGLLATDIVVAAETLIGSRPIDDHDRSALRLAAKFLNEIGKPTDEASHHENFAQLGGMSTLDTLEAIEHEAGQDVTEYLRPLAEELERILEGADPKEHEPALREVVRVFTGVSERELVKVTQFSQSDESPRQWMTFPETSHI